jgi:hypothetical protein
MRVANHAQFSCGARKQKNLLVSASHDEDNRRLCHAAPMERAVRKSVGMPSGR